MRTCVTGLRLLNLRTPAQHILSILNGGSFLCLAYATLADPRERTERAWQVSPAKRGNVGLLWGMPLRRVQ